MTTVDPQAEQNVLHYLDRMVAHDWAAVAERLHPDVVRVGPFGDTFTPRDPYVQFLASLLPSLVGYGLTVERSLGVGLVVVVQLTETMDIGGRTDTTHEVLVFDTDATGLITRIEIYIQRPAS